MTIFFFLYHSFSWLHPTQVETKAKVKKARNVIYKKYKKIKSSQPWVPPPPPPNFFDVENFDAKVI
jgi:hypothetical protein